MTLAFAISIFMSLNILPKNEILPFNGISTQKTQTRNFTEGKNILSSESKSKNQKIDSIQKEFLITPMTSYEELQAIQQLVSENHYQLYIEDYKYINNTLVKVVGYIKHKEAASNNNSFSVTRFKTFKITINKDNIKGKIEIEFTDLKKVKI